MYMAIGTDFFIMRKALLLVLVGARFLIDSFTNFLLLVITFRLVNCVANVFMCINTNLKNCFNSGLNTNRKCNFLCLARIIWKPFKIILLGVLLLIKTENISVESFHVFCLFWCFQDAPSTKLAK